MVKVYDLKETEKYCFIVLEHLAGGELFDQVRWGDIHAYVHTYIHTHTHTYVHTHAYVHTRT